MSAPHHNPMADQPDLFGALPRLCETQSLGHLRPDGRRRARHRPRADRRREGAERAGMHPHSLDAREDCGSTLARRKAVILGWLQRHGPATDRNVKDALFGPIADMNMVRPRITDLIDDGDVAEVGKTVCSVTGVRVRLVRARTLYIDEEI